MNQEIGETGDQKVGVLGYSFSRVSVIGLTGYQGYTNQEYKNQELSGPGDQGNEEIRTSRDQAIRRSGDYESRG